MSATFSSDRPFGEVVRDFTARSHDLEWQRESGDLDSTIARCVYCGGSARDQRPFGLPWVRLVDGTPSLELACEGANNPYATWETSTEHDALQGVIPLDGDVSQSALL